MQNIKDNLLKLLESLIAQDLHQKYDNDINLLKDNNPMLANFISNNIALNQVNNQKIKGLIIQNLRDSDYINILNKMGIKEKLNDQDSPQNQGSISTNNLRFTPLSELISTSLSAAEKAIYTMAVSFAVRGGGTHKISIAINETGQLMPVVMDEDGKITELHVDPDTNVLMSKSGQDVTVLKDPRDENNRGFSDTLILAFIIGSFIGILFLNIYSRIMK